MHQREHQASDALPAIQLLPVLFLQLTVSFGFSLFFLFPKYLTSALHADAATLGRVTAAPLVAAVLVTPLVGAAIDRFGRKLPVAAGGLIVIGSSLGLLFVTDVGAGLYVLRALQGVGFVLGFNGAAACMADVAPATRLGKAMGLLGAASLLMNAAAPSLGELVTRSGQWHQLFVLAAIAGAASVAAVMLTRSPQRSIASAAPLGWTRDSRLAVGTFMNGAAYGTLLTFALPLAMERGADRVSRYLLGYMAGALLVRVLLAGVADELGHRRVARLSLVLLGIVAIATAGLTPGWLAAFGVGLGVAHGFLYPALAAMAAQAAPPERRGRVLSRFAAAFNSGAGVAVFGAGWLARLYGYPFALILVGSLTMFSAIALREAAAVRSQPAT